jgi:hypothetical protein
MRGDSLTFADGRAEGLKELMSLRALLSCFINPGWLLPISIVMGALCYLQLKASQTKPSLINKEQNKERLDCL